MRKLTLLIILYTFSSFGQKDSIEIKGVIFSADHNYVVEKAIVVAYKDGIIKKTLSDKSGHYSLWTNLSLHTITLSINTDKNTTDEDGNSFLASRQFYTINLDDSSSFNKNFVISPVSICPYIPRFSFKRNSCDPIGSIKDSIDILYYWAIKDKHAVFEICGYAGKFEKNPDSLSLCRADIVFQLISNRGIPKERFVRTKGIDITKETPKNQKQRTEIKIINWDYNRK